MKPWLNTLRLWLLAVCQSRAGYRPPQNGPRKP